MKILFLTSRFPYPPFRGDKLRVFNLIKELSKDNEIVVASFAEPEDGIRQRVGSSRAAELVLHFVDGLNWCAVDGDKHIARPDACRHRTTPLRHIGGGDPFRTRFPQDAVLELVRRRAHRDIQRAKAQEDSHQGEEAPASQRTPLRSLGLIFHWFTAIWGTLRGLQTLYPRALTRIWS